MANRLLQQLMSMGRGGVTISGVIKIVGAASAANNVVTVEKGGEGVTSVARSGTGEITMTLDDKWVDLRAAGVSYQGAQARDVALKSFDVISAKTVLINVRDNAAAAVDTGNTETDRIHFTLHLKNSTVR